MTTSLYQNLAQFNGTEQYHQLSLNSHVVATDGVAYLCREGECYWFFDVISSHLGSYKDCVKTHGEDFASWHYWTLTKKGKGAIAEARMDLGEPVKISQSFEYTNFPFDATGVLKLFVSTQQVGHKLLFIVMLPGEN